tara:strand:+ start:1516 stop:1695 length:180 start_codon:yes stop_codon:yes gene_type:complete
MKKVKCPECTVMSEWSEENPYRPFCSKRCQLLDLGAWANGERSIPGQEFEDLGEDREEN